MPGEIGTVKIELSDQSAIGSSLGRTLSERRTTLEQVDPRLKALERFDAQLRPLPQAKPALESRLQEGRLESPLHQRLDQRAGTGGSSFKLQRDGVQCQSRFTQVAVAGGSSAENIAGALSDQQEAIGQVFGIAEALVRFNGNLSGDFLPRIEQGLSALAEATGLDGGALQSTRLDLGISFRSDSVALTSDEGRTKVSRS